MLSLKSFSTKFIAFSLVALHLASIAPNRSQAAEPARDTAEVTLLESLIALQGQKRPEAQLEKEAAQLVRDYENSAPLAGRAERIADASVELRIMTRDQAKLLQATLDRRAAEIVGAGMITNEKRAEIMASVLSESVGRRPLTGAQLSKCGGYILGFSLLVGVSIYMWVYISQMTKQSSSTSVTGNLDQSGTNTSTGNPNGTSSNGSSTTSGSQTTTYSSSNITKDATLKKMLQVTAGVMDGVGAVLFIMFLVAENDNGC